MPSSLTSLSRLVPPHISHSAESSLSSLLGAPWAGNPPTTQRTSNRLFRFRSRLVLLIPPVVSSLEKAIIKALKTHFPSTEPTSSARVEFFNSFQREAGEHDDDFVRQYGGDLDTTLIFVGSFLLRLFLLSVECNFWRVGCFVLRGRFRFHRPRPGSAPTGLHPAEL